VAVQGAMNGPATCNESGWRFGTWNVGTLREKTKEVVDELWLRRVDVCALQETRWRGEGARCMGPKGRRYKLWWKVDDGTGGVGIMVEEELSDKVMQNK
jgi:exonuclease III